MTDLLFIFYQTVDYKIRRVSTTLNLPYLFHVVHPLTFFLLEFLGNVSILQKDAIFLYQIKIIVIYEFSINIIKILKRHATKQHQLCAYGSTFCYHVYVQNFLYAIRVERNLTAVQDLGRHVWNKLLYILIYYYDNTCYMVINIWVFFSYKKLGI